MKLIEVHTSYHIPPYTVSYTILTYKGEKREMLRITKTKKDYSCQVTQSKDQINNPTQGKNDLLKIIKLKA